MALTLINSLLKTRPTPKRLILSLLSAPSMETVEVGHLVQWGLLFGIEPAATRVAVGRLSKQGLITAVARGTCRPGLRDDTEFLCLNRRLQIVDQRLVGLPCRHHDPALARSDRLCRRGEGNHEEEKCQNAH